jgi:hypothetical protein
MDWGAAVHRMARVGMATPMRGYVQIDAGAAGGFPDDPRDP